MRINKKSLILGLTLSSTIFLGASYSALADAITDATSAFRHYVDVGSISISVPTVLDVPLNDLLSFERRGALVLDITDRTFEPNIVKQTILSNPIIITASAEASSMASSNMTDNNLRTYAEFNVPEDGFGTAQIMLNASKPITSSSLTVLLDNYVALPNSVEILALTASGNKIIVAKRAMNGSVVNFPQTTASVWTINFTYSQLLRISELRLAQDNLSKTIQSSVRFLSQPNHNYQIYFDADRNVNVSLSEAGDLYSDKDVIRVSAGIVKTNPGYVVSDIDKDGIPDMRDNCVSLSNTDQEDGNGNGRGDACDDFDRDGIINSLDNCPNNPNAGQGDTDGDKMGDVCDDEESRITEKYGWLPWVGIGIAAAVFIGMFAIMLKPSKK